MTTNWPTWPLVVGWDLAISRWAGEQLGINDFGPCHTVGVVDREGKLIAAAVFNNYRPPNVEVTLVSTTPRWCSRGVMRGIFSVPFQQYGCARLTAVTGSKNQRVRAFLCHLGFQQEGVMRRGFRDGDDAVIYGMLAEECRWLQTEKPHVKSRR